MTMMIRNANDALKICADKAISLASVALTYELQRGEMDEKKVMDKMMRNFSAMKASVHAGLNDPTTGGKMFKDDAKRLMAYQAEREPFSGRIATAASYALAVMEVNCSMGRIVAAPTAGSCGVLPAAILSATEILNGDDSAAANALLTAGLVGMIIGKNASLSGAERGCQAEIGAAAAMAAAAVTEMAGGTPKQSFDAAAISLKAMMGLVCDPVAGLVEVPCAKRNGMGVSNALLAVDMVLSGIESVIPFDEVVWAMNKVGRAMPGSLKETAEGGVAITPTGKKLNKKIFGK